MGQVTVPPLETHWWVMCTLWASSFRSCGRQAGFGVLMPSMASLPSVTWELICSWMLVCLLCQEAGHMVIQYSEDGCWAPYPGHA